MKAKMVRKSRYHAKPVHKSIRGKKRLQRAPRAAKKIKIQAAPMEGEIMEGVFEGAIEFIDVDPEPVVEVFDVYETEGEEDAV